MPIGQHYEVLKASDYRPQYEEFIRGNARLERAHSGMVQWLERAPKSFPVSRHLQADYWMARLDGPPRLAIFYSVDDEQRTVTLNGLTLWP